jgi:hypothetical protein
METEYRCQRANSNENRIIWNRGWIVMRLVVAFVLLIAAILKTHQLATTPSLGEGLLHARWFNIFVVEFELFFGIWLIFGMLPKLTWSVSVGLFSIFSIVSFYKVISGERSCGCFGEVSVNPWFTMLFDLLVIGLLVYLRPNKSSADKLKYFFYHYNSRLILCIGVFVLLGCTVYSWIVQKTYERLEHFGQILENHVVQLNPESWIGKEFPLRDYIVEGQEIMQRKWTILLVRPGCEHCAKVKTQLIQNSKQNQISVAFLDIASKISQPNISEKIRNNRLVSEVTWVVNTPVVLVLQDGIVQDVQLQK